MLSFFPYIHTTTITRGKVFSKKRVKSWSNHIILASTTVHQKMLFEELFLKIPHLYITYISAFPKNILEIQPSPLLFLFVMF